MGWGRISSRGRGRRTRKNVGTHPLHFHFKCQKRVCLYKQIRGAFRKSRRQSRRQSRRHSRRQGPAPHPHPYFPSPSLPWWVTVGTTVGIHGRGDVSGFNSHGGDFTSTTWATPGHGREESDLEMGWRLGRGGVEAEIDPGARAVAKGKRRDVSPFDRSGPRLGSLACPL